MKYLITERQYSMLLEDQVPIPLSLPNTNPIFGNIITMNKKYFGLPATPEITPEYTKKINDELSKKNVSPSNRTLLGSAAGLLPIWGDALDFATLVDGFRTKDLEKVYGGAVALLNPSFSYKAISSFVDYLGEKIGGKDVADYWEKKRNEVLNMSSHDREELFKRYGMGGYDKWVKDGKPKLSN